ncbi:unnamed protein product, partial [Prorocentrum cordatum]
GGIAGAHRQRHGLEDHRERPEGRHYPGTKRRMRRRAWRRRTRRAASARAIWGSGCRTVPAAARSGGGRRSPDGGHHGGRHLRARAAASPAASIRVWIGQSLPPRPPAPPTSALGHLSSVSFFMHPGLVFLLWQMAAERVLLAAQRCLPGKHTARCCLLV